MFQLPSPIKNRNALILIAHLLFLSSACAESPNDMVRLHSFSPEMLLANGKEKGIDEPPDNSEWSKNMWTNNPFSKHTCLLSISCTRDGTKCQDAVVETRLREACPAGSPPLAKIASSNPNEKDEKKAELSEYLCDANRTQTWEVGSNAPGVTAAAKTGALEIQVRDNYGISKEEDIRLKSQILDALAIWRGACRFCSEKMWLGVIIDNDTHIPKSIEKLISKKYPDPLLNNLIKVRGLTSPYLNSDPYKKITIGSKKYQAFCKQDTIPSDETARSLLQGLVCHTDSRKHNEAKIAIFELRNDGTSCANNAQSKPTIRTRGSLAASLPVVWCEPDSGLPQEVEDKSRPSKSTILGCSASDKPVELNLRDVGFYTDKRQEKLIGKSINLAPLLPVLIHEIGHWLGVPHNNEVDTMPSVENTGQNMNWAMCPSGVTRDAELAASRFAACTHLGDTRCASNTQLYYARDDRPWSLMGDTLNSMEACISTFDRDLLVASVRSPNAFATSDRSTHHGFKIDNNKFIQKRKPSFEK